MYKSYGTAGELLENYWRTTGELLEGLRAKILFADRGYDTNEILEYAENRGMQAIISPKKNRKMQRDHDKELYKLRHLVENAFLKLKRWGGVATRYAKNSASFFAIVLISCLFLWLNR